MGVTTNRWGALRTFCHIHCIDPAVTVKPHRFALIPKRNRLLVLVMTRPQEWKSPLGVGFVGLCSQVVWERCKTLILTGRESPMAIKFFPGTTAILAAMLISGCVKQHANWHEVPLAPSFPFPYVSLTAQPEPRTGSQLTPNPSLRTSPITRPEPASSYSGTSYSRSSGGSSGFGGDNSGGGYRGGSYLSRGARVTLAITLLFLIFVAPWVWFLYPSWKRARKSNGPVTPAAPPPQAPQIPSRETWESLGLCPDCGSRMVPRVAKRGRHKGKSFYGCSKFPRCTGIRQTIPDQLPAVASKSGALDGTVSPGSHQ